jgi:hypothetical protein
MIRVIGLQRKRVVLDDQVTITTATIQSIIVNLSGSRRSVSDPAV